MTGSEFQEIWRAISELTERVEELERKLRDRELDEEDNS